MANKQLKLMFFGGVEEVGKNLTVLEYGENIIVIDVGMSFPNVETMPGVDFLIPNLSFLLENKQKIRGVFITHGHEDHIGGISYLLKDVDVPVYGSKLAMAFIENKLNKSNIEQFNLFCVDDGDIVDVEPFKVEFISVTHSVAGAYALAIHTPKGLLFFTGDFKIDFNPVDKKRMNLSRVAALGSEGVLLMLQDSTNAMKPGYSMSESSIGITFDSIFNENRSRRIIVATFASNIHRIQQVIDCAKKYNRKIAFSGRSIKNTVEIAEKLGYLKLDVDNVIDAGKIKDIPDDRLCIIATGTQGEPTSALTKMSIADFRAVKLSNNDTIIVSASVIPGNERAIHQVMNNLAKIGVNLIYSAIEAVHSSGHAYKEELKMLIALAKPRFFIPVHGEYRMLKAHAELAQSMGIPKANIYIPELGDTVEISKAGIKKVAGNFDSTPTMIAGDIENDMGTVVDRKRLAEAGVIIAVLYLGEKANPSFEVNLISKGVVIPSDLTTEIKESLSDKFADGQYFQLTDTEIRDGARKTIEKIFVSNTKQSPIIIPIVIPE